MALIDVLIVSRFHSINKLVERMEATNAESEMRDDAARDTLELCSDNLEFGAETVLIGFGLLGFGLLGFVVLFSL
jgi:hypothetical protein